MRPEKNLPEKARPEKNIPDWDRPDLVLENSSTPRLHDFTTPDLHESTAMLLRYSMLPCLGVLSGHDLSTGGPGHPSSVGIHGSQSAKVRWASTGPKEPLTWSLRRISLTGTTLTWSFRTPELHESTAMRLHYSTTPRLHDSTTPRPGVPECWLRQNEK